MTQKKKKKVFTRRNPLKIENRYLKSCFVFMQIVHAPDPSCLGGGTPGVLVQQAPLKMGFQFLFKGVQPQRSTVGAFAVPFGIDLKILMHYLRIGACKERKLFHATPTKQDLGTWVLFIIFYEHPHLF